MTEENNDTSEDKEKSVHKETRLDMDRLTHDFAVFMGQPESKRKSRIDRMIQNVVHMALVVVTAGAYLFAYLGYYVYKFFDRHDLDDYKVEVEVKAAEKDEGVEE